jgi:hypothetical protein
MENGSTSLRRRREIYKILDNKGVMECGTLYGKVRFQQR